MTKAKGSLLAKKKGGTVSLQAAASVGAAALQEQVSHCSLGFYITHSVPCPLSVPFSISLWKDKPQTCTSK